ncbi:MAG: site-2 protease family protein [Bowdeniella nasicola]|nr:site-2 protease family protein [Bowdeniella nasicola]
MAYLIGIAALILGLLVSIALHEIGHMVPAKAFGVKVPQYFVGFGPTLWSTRRGETEYGIKAIPLGGYVRLAGMFPPEPQASTDAPDHPNPEMSREPVDGVAPAPEHTAHQATSVQAATRTRRTLAEQARYESSLDLAPGEHDRALYALSVPKKIAVMVGGPLMNLVIAFVLFAVILMGWGLPAPSTTLSDVPECRSQTSPCADPSPAYEAGLRAGDTITAYGGSSVDTWEDLTAAIAAGGGAPARVDYVSHGHPASAEVTPVRIEATADAPERYVIGVVAGSERRTTGVGTVFSITGTAVKETLGVIVKLPMRLYDVAVSTVTGTPREDGVMSIVGVGRVAGEVASTMPTTDDQGRVIDAPTFGERAMTMLSLLASLNIALFAFNLIPLPPLDGGHIAGALWEGARRQVARLRGKSDPGPVDMARLLPLTYTVFFALIIMTVLLGYADIVNPVTF